MIAVPPSQFQRLCTSARGDATKAVEPVTSRRAGSYEAIPADPPETPPDATGRVAGAPGGGNGALWTEPWLFETTDPVVSWDELCVANGLPLLSKRWVSPLQLTATTEIEARMARRKHWSERTGSATRGIGFPTRTQQDGERVNNAPVNKRLRFERLFQP
jgi:hypothetical protein